MTQTIKTIDVLREARERIANESRWTKFSWARDNDGESVDPEDPSATCWCVFGSILLSIRKRGGYDRVQGYSNLWVSLNKLSEWSAGVSDLGHLNDSIGHAAALRVLDAAIAELEAQP